ncbi:hypothetical protein P43SY_011000 [Pythium insidiosum]|uniref:Uncharacterized protein n=1 Tax=Pythium insidiosum TaxID=114742 RepID=A0AAD5L9I5_PYTIN|nr:hypothetical protein P43SY_011000 [Pythium insidiosum]
MVKRYVEIREAIMTVSAVEELVPRGATHRRIQALLTKLEELGSVCVKLQAEKRTLGDVRLLFDACVAKYPAMAQHLLSGASIVHSPLFESAVAKLINDVPLAAREQKAVASFVVTPPPQQPVDESVDFDHLDPASGEEATALGSQQRDLPSAAPQHPSNQQPL